MGSKKVQSHATTCKIPMHVPKKTQNANIMQNFKFATKTCAAT